MAETDDIVARLCSRLSGLVLDLRSDEQNDAADDVQLAITNLTALTDRDAQIERLKRENAGAKILAEAGIDVGKPMRETLLHFLNKAKAAEARATTAERERDELKFLYENALKNGKFSSDTMDRELSEVERERDEARAERDRLENERAEEWRKRRNAEGDRDVLNAANGTLREELAEARAEVERKDTALRRLLGVCPEEHGCFPRNRCQSEHTQTDDDELVSAIATARAALTNGGDDGDA